VYGFNIMVSSELRDIDYERISRLVYEQCGINLHEGKRELIKARLGKRLREGAFKSFGEYYSFVTTEQGTEELISMIDSLSTNLTYFFREESHFKKLREVIPAILKEQDQNGQTVKLRIWSAGCSSGEEPYSLAMTAAGFMNSLTADIRILATDISTRVLQTAVKGVFSQERLKVISSADLRKYFQMGSGQWKGHYRIKKSLRDMIQFTRFNLMDKPPANYQFHVIFCRNVMIYFDKVTQGALVNRFFQCQDKGGYLFIGHSESLTGLNHSFKYMEPSVYRK
jgi:chemotaxis protein methyltransferase CheR